MPEREEKKEQDLADIILEETRRGRRPVDTAALRERTEMLRVCRRLLESQEEEDLREAMRAAGLSENSPAFGEALRIWRAYRAGRRP